MRNGTEKGRGQGRGEIREGPMDAEANSVGNVPGPGDPRQHLEGGGKGATPERRGSRRRGRARARTLAVRQVRMEELRLGRLLYPPRPGDEERPRTRGECRNMPRPCPYVGCKYHLYLDVSPRGGLKLNFPDLEPWELEETCALDVAERPGTVTLEDVGRFMNLTRERVRQVEATALQRIYPYLIGIMDLTGAGLSSRPGGRSRRRPTVEDEPDWECVAGDEEDWSA